MGGQRCWGCRGALACLGRTPASGFTSAHHSSPLSGAAAGGHYHCPILRWSSELRGHAHLECPHSQGRPGPPPHFGMGRPSSWLLLTWSLNPEA